MIVALAFALVAQTAPAPAPAAAAEAAEAAPAPAAAPAPPAPATAVVEQKPKILVLDFRDDGVGESAVRIIHDTLVSHVSKDTRLDVISSEDVRQAVAREAERREATNCNEEGCLAEIAEALGAQLTLYGTAGKLGDLVVVNVNLYDARNARSVGRETIEVSSLDRLPNPLREAGDKLIAQLGLAETVQPGLDVGPIFWTGIGIIGVGVVADAIAVPTYYGNVSAVADADTFQEKTSAKESQDIAGGVALAGAAVILVGIVVAAASFALE